MKLVRVSRNDSSWSDLLRQWEELSSDFGEDFAEYAPASLEALRPLAEQPQMVQAGVYAVCHDSNYMGICQLNCAHLPGYDNKVLRVRHIVHSPRFDYADDVGEDEYATFLSDIFIGAYNASISEMPAPYIKFHFRSPAERRFFSVLKRNLSKVSQFKEIEMRGAWLYVSR